MPTHPATPTPTLAPVELKKAYRLLNHGPTVLISAEHAQQRNVMAAAWACALDFDPPKVTVVLDKSSYTRSLIERCGYFAVQIPCKAQIALTLAVGTESAHDVPNKLEKHQVSLFYPSGYENIPLVSGCVGWLICRVMDEPHNQQTYDLFIGEVVAAWSDTRVFRDGHWLFDEADDDLRSIHYIAGGQFYVTGDSVHLREYD